MAGTRQKKINDRVKGKASDKKKGERGDLEIYGMLREDIGMKDVPARPNGLREKAETAIPCREPGPTRSLDLPERKKIYIRSGEEGVATNMCPCGTTTESRTHIVGECKIYKEERDALEEMMKFEICDMEEFGRLESSEETIAILGDRWWPQTAKQDGDRIS